MKLILTLALALGMEAAQAVTIDTVYFAQTHVQEATHSYFYLVGNRDTFIKAHVVDPASPASPPVTANGVEYVLDGTASANDRSKLPGIAINGGNVIFTFNRAQSSIDGPTTLAIETGTDLGTWSNSYAVPDGAASSNPGVSVVKNTPPGFDTVTLSVPQGAKTFVRLKVVIPAP